MPIIDMKMAQSTLFHARPFKGESLSFYVRPGRDGDQYAGIVFLNEQRGKPAIGNALYKINIRCK